MLDTLRVLLANEIFPQLYTHKFIGNHQEPFLQAVRHLQAHFVHLDITVTSRLSRHGDYIAYTFTFVANTQEDVLSLVEETSKLEGLKMVL